MITLTYGIRSGRAGYGWKARELSFWQASEWAVPSGLCADVLHADACLLAPPCLQAGPPPDVQLLARCAADLLYVSRRAQPPLARTDPCLQQHTTSSATTTTTASTTASTMTASTTAATVAGNTVKCYIARQWCWCAMCVRCVHNVTPLARITAPQQAAGKGAFSITPAGALAGAAGDRLAAGCVWLVRCVPW
jgi:hypothetical protein